MQKPSYDMRISDWSSDVCFADLRRPRLEVQRHRLVVDDLVAEPARGAPAYVEALHPVAFPTPEAEGEGTVVEPRLRLIFGDEFLDRGRAVGALIIGLRKDPVDPVAHLVVERDAVAEAYRNGVTAALRCADLDLALPITPEFSRAQVGDRQG